MRFYLQSLIWLFALTVAAEAGPLAAAISAFASTTLGGIIVNAVVGIALSIGTSLLQSLFTKKTDTKDPGTSLQLRVGGDNSLFFPLGRNATGGVRVYFGTWMNPGGTPNEYIADVIALSALPVSGSLTALWMNDQKVTVRTDLPKTAQGWPIEEYFKNGQYYAWVDFFDGTQTTASPYLISKFGADPKYPWQSDMVGPGVAYAIFTARYDKDGLWSGGYPSMLFEVPSIAQYDPRKDSTNGGSGSHRWGNWATYEPSNNAMVRAYNVARGIYYNGEWVYGGQNWPAFRLPVSSWAAGMNACDLVVDGEPQFHGGGIVECDVEPAATMEELLKSSSGLIAESGGLYKIRIGAPGAPVFSYTDDNVVITREQGYEPFPGLESTFNIVRISYTEPVEKWSNKESPERRDAAFIVSDDNRELPMSVSLPWVLSNTTAQRIGKTALYNGRRFRKHQHFLPPVAWLLEPLDVVAWTSAHNSYVNKSFDIEQISGTSSFLQGVTIREVDPSDFNWNPITDKLAYQTIPLVPRPVAAQPMTGWQVFPDYIADNDGTPRRPTIRVEYATGLTDIDRVRVQVRVEGETQPMFDGEIPYSVTGSVKLAGQFTPNTAYEARGILIPWTDRSTDWSAWLDVTTPDVKLIPGLDFDPYSGVTGFENLDSDLAGYQAWIGGSLREIERRFEEIDLWVSDQDFGNEYDRQQIRQQLTATYDNAKAEWKYDVDVVAGQNAALSSRVETLTATVNTQSGSILANANAISGLQTSVTIINGQVTSLSSDLTSLTSTVNTNTGQIAGQATAISALETDVTAVEGSVTSMAQAVTSLSAGTAAGDVNTANFRMQVVSGPAGYSRIGAEGRQGGTGAWRSAGWYLDVPNSTALPTRFTVQADQFVVISGTNTAQPFVFQGSTAYLENARIGTVIFNQLSSANGKLVLKGSGSNASLEIFS